MNYSISIFVIIIILIILIISINYIFSISKINIFPLYDKSIKSNNKLDPIMDPRYNMQEVCKQSALLEEHIMNPKKRCCDCICKHFLLITGYAEEAVELATNKVNRYPNMKESCILYNDLFKDWLKIKKDGLDKNEEELLNIADKLRKNRKILVSQYFYT